MTNIWSFIVLVFAARIIGATANAAIIDVNMNTAPLVGHPAGFFSLLFILTDGNGVGDANNTVTVSNIDFGGGGSLGGTVAFGGASGSSQTGITITDSSLINLIIEQFAPGSELAFTLHVTLHDDAGGIPDRLTLSILDNSGVPLPTLAPAGDYFFGVDLGSIGPVAEAFGSTPFFVPAPQVTVSAVPEIRATYLSGFGLLGILIARRCLLIHERDCADLANAVDRRDFTQSVRFLGEVRSCVEPIVM